MLGGGTYWLWRAVNEHGEVLDVLLQRTRCKNAAKRYLQRLLDEQDVPEQIVTDTPFGAQAGSGAMARPSARRPSWDVCCTSRSRRPSARTT